MEIQEIIKNVKMRMDKNLETLNHELAKLRTSRAAPALVDTIKIEYYGSTVPLKQIASITTPEPRMLLIQPWDASVAADIEKAILKSELGITPNSDGKVIRIILPSLTEERRQDLVKLVKKISEEFKVAVRNIRRDANEEIKVLEKDSKITEDERYKAQEDIQKVTDKHIKEIDEIIATKEKEILEV